jgi:transposase
VRSWQYEILAYHSTGQSSNGPTEAVNLLIEKVRRIDVGRRLNLASIVHANCCLSWLDNS